MDSREQILHLMNLYGFTIDTGDFNGFAELFAHGEWTMEGGASAMGKDQLLAGMANIRAYEDGTPKTRHATTNMDLAIDEKAGTAKSQCSLKLWQSEHSVLVGSKSPNQRTLSLRRRQYRRWSAIGLSSCHTAAVPRRRKRCGVQKSKARTPML